MNNLRVTVMLCVRVVCIKQGGTQYYTRAGAMGVAALGRQTAYGARPSESRKLRAAAACMTEVGRWRRLRIYLVYKPYT